MKRLILGFALAAALTAVLVGQGINTGGARGGSNFGGDIVVAGTIKRTSSTWIDGSGPRMGAGMGVRWSQAFSDPNDLLDTGLGRNAAGVVEVNNGSNGTYRDILVRQAQTSAVTVATLQTCNAGAKGMRGFVTDATVATFMTAATGGGANNVPVVCDGTSWKIG